MNYFELYPGDYMRDTTRLSLIEHGAYLKLMLTYYGEEQPLPAGYDELYQISAAISVADKAAVRKVADKFFPIASDGLRHKNRIDEEIAKAQKRIAIARDNGAKNKTKTNPVGNPVGMPPAPFRVGPEDTQLHTRSGEALHTPHATIDQELSAAPPVDTPQADPIWGTGLDFLLRKGLAKGSSRSLIGLMRKELQDDFIVAELLIEAERQDICSPQAWLLQAAKARKAGGSGKKHTATENFKGKSYAGTDDANLPPELR